VSENPIAAVLPKGTPARRKKGFSAMRRKEHPPRRCAFPATFLFLLAVRRKCRRCFSLPRRRGYAPSEQLAPAAV